MVVSTPHFSHPSFSLSASAYRPASPSPISSSPLPRIVRSRRRSPMCRSRAAPMPRPPSRVRACVCVLYGRAITAYQNIASNAHHDSFFHIRTVCHIRHAVMWDGNQSSPNIAYHDSFSIYTATLFGLRIRTAFHSLERKCVEKYLSDRPICCALMFLLSGI